jgi:hypothetical protein
MPEHTQNGMQCHEFDALLSEALDGALSRGELDRFQAHARSCVACGPLFAEAEAGRRWLKGLTEVEPPASLVASILASTTGVDTQRLRATAQAPQRQVSWLENAQAWLSGSMEPILATIRQPRFAMSFGMAFFALSVGLTVAGVKPSDLRQISLRPAAIRRTYYATQAKVVRYYENARIVYELQSRLREFRRMVPAEPGPATQKDQHKNDTTQQPEQREERNYSQTDHDYLLADAPLGPNLDDLPVVSVSTYRRFV